MEGTYRSHAALNHPDYHEVVLSALLAADIGAYVLESMHLLGFVAWSALSFLWSLRIGIPGESQL